MYMKRLTASGNRKSRASLQDAKEHGAARTQGPEQGGQHKGIPTVQPQTQQGEGAAVAGTAAWVQDPSQRQEKRQTYLQCN